MWSFGGPQQAGGCQWKVLWESLLIVTLIFTPLWNYSEVMVFAVSLRAHRFLTAAGRRDDPAAGIEAPVTLLTRGLPGLSWLRCAACLSTAGHRQNHCWSGQARSEICMHMAGWSLLWVCCNHHSLPSLSQCFRKVAVQRSPHLKSTKLAIFA